MVVGAGLTLAAVVVRTDGLSCSRVTAVSALGDARLFGDERPDISPNTPLQLAATAVTFGAFIGGGYATVRATLPAVPSVVAGAVAGVVPLAVFEAGARRVAPDGPPTWVIPAPAQKAAFFAALGVAVGVVSECSLGPKRPLA